MSRDEWGSGSVYQRRDGRWVAQTEKQGVRKYAYGKTFEEAVNKVYDITPRLPVSRPRDKRQDYALANQRRDLRGSIVNEVLAVAESEGWSREHTATVIVAQLSAKRIKFGVRGPCAYCGTWFAHTVDHVVPVALGGTDDPSNIVSACFPCNTRKADRTPETWRKTVSPDAHSL